MKLNRLFVLLFCIFGATFFSAQERYNTLVYEGNKEFDGKNYDNASSKYMEAIKQNDKNFSAHYNLGNALYKRKMYKEAEAEYQKAENLATTKADKAAAIYNQGNVQMQSNNSEKAAELYKKSLKVDPYNESVRKNYEIAKLKEKEKQNQQNQNKDSKGGGNDGKDQNQSSDSKDGKNQQQQSGGNQQNQQGQGKGNNADPNKTENNAGNMPKDLENAILNRVQNRERETARKILNKNAYSMPESNEKDW